MLVLYDTLCTGGLVCRAILNSVPNHNVRTFISLSSPQGGQFGGRSLNSQPVFLLGVFPLDWLMCPSANITEAKCALWKAVKAVTFSHQPEGLAIYW